jgi:hypothetical protein
VKRRPGKQQEQFFTALPLEEPGALKGQFRFIVPDGHFDLPSTSIIMIVIMSISMIVIMSISMDDEPGVLQAADGLGDE